METNVLYYGDNLEILRKYIPDNSIDLIYLDPPFNSQATYNVLFKEPVTGKPSQAQIEAFQDTWHWFGETPRTYEEICRTAPARVVEMMKAFRSFLGGNDMMAYLTMMCIRLLELRRVLKDSGSIYLHCDPTASHYLKLLMDAVFGARQFRNELVWCYETAGKSKKQFSRKHDVILFYSMSAEWIFNTREVAIPRKPNKHMKVGVDESGREYEEKKDKRTGKVYRWYFDEGRLPLDYWTDIPFMNREEAQRLGYPTQKPEALLERIIKASSNEGDLVLDPFCGCGTALVAAERLKRRWIGIDITHLAVGIMKWRLEKTFPGIKYKVVGEPVDLEGAKALAAQNKYQFQWWAVSLIGGQPYGDRKKGADTGIDGYVYFMDEKDKVKKAIVSVKGGGTSVKDVRDLSGVIDREKAEMGIFLTLEPPTKPMMVEAASKGFYSSPQGRDYPRLQILTIEECLAGKKPDLPPWVSPVPAPERARRAEGEQRRMV